MKKEQKLNPPEWLGKEARQIWNRKLKEAKGVLTILDTEMLAVYCSTAVRFQKLRNKNGLTLTDYKAMQAYLKIILKLANKLGFTPASRAKMAKLRLAGTGIRG